MSMQGDYAGYLERQKALAAGPMAHIWQEQEKRYVAPFQIYGNLYFVGDDWVCAHLIDTGDGLLLLDAGNCGATAMLVHSIWKLGFDPANIKWLVLSHGHVDHFGAANFLRRMFGTKIYLGEPDAKMFAEKPGESMIQDNPDISESLFVPDEVIRDGDVKTFGGTEFAFRLVPGHTEGTIAAFFDITDGKQTRRAGHYGGFGFNTLTKDFLREIGDDGFKTRQVFLESLAKVRDERVEVFVANHCVNNKLLERREKMLADPAQNPFVDERAWPDYLDEKRDALLAFMADPANN